MSKLARRGAVVGAATAAVASVLAAVPTSATAADDLPVVFTSDRDGDSDIYLRSAAGAVTRLTSNRAADYGAVWSPDGKQLAFVSDRDGDDEIYVVNADGKNLRQLTRNSKARNGAPANDQAPAWSRDGKRLVFTSTRDGGEHEIYRMNANGTGQVRLTKTADHVADHTPSFSPGGHYVVFSSNRAGYENFEVYRMRINGTDVRRLTTTAAGIDDNAPEYSPDGRTLVFSSTRNANQHDLFTMRGDGSGVAALTGDRSVDEVFPRWTSDGKQVVFTTWPNAEVSASGDDVAVVRADGSQRRVLVGDDTSDTLGDPRPAGR